MESTRDLAIPTEQQLIWQRKHAFALFLHFGINTFHGREWSDGTLPPSTFSPSELDCRQWVSLAKAAGAAHVILTAKHHDGFCLWPTATKNYSVAASPWKNGQGDVVRELSVACAEQGLGLGLYLSPWDRNDPDWAKRPDVYDARYIEQLTELCRGYGPLVELWFDGAGSEHHPYDWPAIMGVIRQYQPDAMIFNMGDPTIRWVGNEDGLASDPVWYAVDSVGKSIYDDAKVGLEGGDRYLPPECDVAIRRHWFWQPDDLATLKSVDHLMAIWYRSIGLGANLLLNVPPDRRGLIDDRDAERLMAFAKERDRRFSRPVTAHLESETNRVIAVFDEEVTIDHVWLEEDLLGGQVISGHEVRDVQTGTLLAEGITIGVRRIHAFPEIRTRRLSISLDGELGTPRLARVTGYHTGCSGIPALEDQPEFDLSKM